MKDWQSKWAIEISDCKAGVGSDYQDPISDCVAEADAEIDALKQEIERLKNGIAKAVAISLEVPDNATSVRLFLNTLLKVGE